MLQFAPSTSGGVRIADQAVMPGKARQSDLQHDFARAFRPAFAALRVFQPQQMTADIDEDAAQLRPHSRQCTGNALARGQNRIVEMGNLAPAPAR
jgi:hypothetical protein